MSSDQTIAQVYNGRRLLAIRFAGIFILMIIVGIAILVDIRNPPLTTNGPLLGALFGGFVGTVVTSWLIRFAKPSDVKIEPEEDKALVAGVSTLVLSFILYFIVGIVLFLLISLLTRGVLSGTFPFAYPGIDFITSLSMIIAALLATLIVPEAALNYDDDINIRSNTTSSRSQPATDTDADSTQTETDISSSTDSDTELNELLDSIRSSRASAQESIQNRSYDSAIEQIETALDACREATDLNETHQLGRIEEIENEHTILEELLEDAQQKCEEQNEQATKPQEETGTGQASKRINGFLGAAASHCSQVEQSLEGQNYEQAVKRVGSARDSLNQAEELNNQHGLEREEAIAEQREKLSELFEMASSKTLEQYSVDLQRATLANNDIEKVKAIVSEIETQLDSVQDALQSGDYDRAEQELHHLRDAIAQFEQFDDAESTVSGFRAKADELEQRVTAKRASERLNGFLGAVGSSRSQAEQLLEEGNYDGAIQRLDSAQDSLEQAEELNDRHGLGRNETIAEQSEEVSALLEIASSKLIKERSVDLERDTLANNDIENVEAVVSEVETQLDSVQRALQTREDDRAEQELDRLREAISQFETFDSAESLVTAFSEEADELAREIAEKRASKRVNGFFGAIGSSRSQAEQLLEEGNYEQAFRRLESARDSLEQAEELNDRHELGHKQTIAGKKEGIRTLLETASNKPDEELATTLEEAEEAVASGIEARDASDVTTAAESFETALDRYESASELVVKYDLDQQWEVEQRRSMVEEYLEVTRDALNDRRRDVRDGLERTLETAESSLLRAEQHTEVEDYVSARETLTEARGYIDDAARLLETGLATNRLEDRYDDVRQREKGLRDQLPDEESEGYRTRDLVESLQMLASKLGESPRPEFVTQYGEFPADAYLETFGSWPEALAAANLDPIDEASRERRSYSRVEVLDAVVELADELGHPPSKSDMNQKGSMSASPVQSRFKDWDIALEVAGVTGEQAEAESGGREEAEKGEEEESIDGILEEIESEIQGFSSE